MQDEKFHEVNQLIMRLDPNVETLQAIQGFLKLYTERKIELEIIKAPLNYN